MSTMLTVKFSQQPHITYDIPLLTPENSDVIVQHNEKITDVVDSENYVADDLHVLPLETIIRHKESEEFYTCEGYIFSPRNKNVKIERNDENIVLTLQSYEDLDCDSGYVKDRLENFLEALMAYELEENFFALFSTDIFNEISGKQHLIVYNRKDSVQEKIISLENLAGLDNFVLNYVSSVKAVDKTQLPGITEKGLAYVTDLRDVINDVLSTYNENITQELNKKKILVDTWEKELAEKARPTYHRNFHLIRDEELEKLMENYHYIAQLAEAENLL